MMRYARIVEMSILEVLVRVSCIMSRYDGTYSGLWKRSVSAYRVVRLYNFPNNEFISYFFFGELSIKTMPFHRLMSGRDLN